MDEQNYTYAIGDVIKTRKMLHLERYEDKPIMVIDHWKHSNTTEYKVIVCGEENQFFYFTEHEIEGKF